MHPASKSNLQTSVWPPDAAKISGVKPEIFVLEVIVRTNATLLKRWATCANLAMWVHPSIYMFRLQYGMCTLWCFCTFRGSLVLFTFRPLLRYDYRPRYHFLEFE